MVNYLLIRSFSNEEEADDIIELLGKNSIDYVIQNIDVNLIPFFQESSKFKYGLFIDEADISEFEKLLESSLTKVPEENDIFQEMTDAELMDVLHKFDEWSFEDLLVARRILTGRGNMISDQEISEYKKLRVEELRKQIKGNFVTTLVGFILPVIGLISMTKVGLFGNIIYLFSYGIGVNYLLDYKKLPNNEKVKVYDRSTRKIGLLIIIWAVLVTVGSFLIYKYLLATD
jgi:hypothetical protein